MENISFGHHYFDIAKILREARLINAILTNAEVWYSLGNREIADLQQVDYMMLRKVLAVPSSVSIESLYLELGIIPLNIILKSRRINYLHYLANQKENSMLFKVFINQWRRPVKGDWVEEAKMNLEEFEINLSLDDLRNKSKSSFKKLVKNKTKEFTLNYLLDLKEKHSKMENLNYTELKMQSYLRDPRITVAEAKNIFRFRTRSALFKENMRSNYTDDTCPLCKEQPDRQSHSFECKIINSRISVQGSYKDIFKKKITPELSKTLLEITQIRSGYIQSPGGDPRASDDATV